MMQQNTQGVTPMRVRTEHPRLYLYVCMCPNHASDSTAGSMCARTRTHCKFKVTLT